MKIVNQIQYSILLFSTAFKMKQQNQRSMYSHKSGPEKTGLGKRLKCIAWWILVQLSDISDLPAWNRLQAGIFLLRSHPTTLLIVCKLEY